MRYNSEGEEVFRLEWNEKQQHFHMNNYNKPENTHGWKTVLHECTDKDLKLIEFVLERDLGKEYGFNQICYIVEKTLKLKEEVFRIFN